MGSIRFEGVRFVVWSHDHSPPHVHGVYAEIEVIVELLEEQRGVRLARRKNAKRPVNASRSDVQHILETAAEHLDELIALWRSLHG